ncbi:DUF4132 domain-containing protein [Streptomyces sp. NPDC051211]|uniref:DUF4132 domain-containing protein n=1 Tax=Streptomyces sp. NPDC051211 TaxID=3154643 RepID=UPI00344B760C
MQRWEHVGEGSAKFWEGEAEGTSVTLRYGRVGTAGQTRVKEFDTVELAAAYLEKAVVEREKKGYTRTDAAAAGPAAEAVAEAAAAAAGPAAPAGNPAPAVLRDEDALVLPAAWKRNLLPRRGGTPRTVTPVPAAARRTGEWLAADADFLEQTLAAEGSAPELVAAARAHLDGSSPSPLGAAVLAAVVRTQDEDDSHSVYADAWTQEFGLVFAARATVELGEVVVEHVDRGGRAGSRISRRTEDHQAWRTVQNPAAARMRVLLAAADADLYGRAVAALADHRDTPRRRVTVSFLVPTEQEWVDECCADPATRDHPVTEVRAMLVCSLGTAGQVALLNSGGHGYHLGWHGWSAAITATAAEGVGAALAPLLDAEMKTAYHDADTTRSLSEALAELPGDEAFGFLLDRLEHRTARGALMNATRTFPVRALRMIADTALRGETKAAAALRLLETHVAAHRELALAVLPELPAPAAELVERLARKDSRLPEAPAETLPALLTSPPWTRRRKAVKPRVVAGLTAPAGVRVSWQPGEREEWAAAESAVTGWTLYGELEEALEEHRRGTLNEWQSLTLFTKGPVEAVRPLLAEWHGPSWSYDGPETFQPVIAAHGAAALRMATSMACGHPATLGPLLLPFLELGVARRLADWLVRLKTAGRTARAYFVRHGADAARLLVPDALGTIASMRTAAETALKVIAAAHGPEPVLAAAAEYGPEAAEVVELLLSADPFEAALPARLPVVGGWVEPHGLPQLKLTTGQALPAEATRHLLMMMALSKPDTPYPGIGEVQPLFEAESLAEFAWALFEEWRLVGMPAKEAWILHALGYLGDDETVRRLTPLIRRWPGAGAHQRAVDGLDVLAAIGTDTALLSLHGIAQRVKFKALKARAVQKIDEVAAVLGLTGEQLSDRLVPDFGLDAEGTTVVDYGPRRFTVGFDEQLKPYVLDETGKRLKDLPKPGVKDDAEQAPAERKRFAALKKDVRTIASDQVRRLEDAMVAQRTWTGAEFRRLFVEHPLVWHLARRLVWLAEAEGTVTAFRVAEDRTYADVEDETVTLADDAVVRLAHPLHLGAEALPAWSELFADYEILQPFRQLGRPVHVPTEEEAAGYRLTRFEGFTVPVGRLLGLTKRGWERGVPQDAGVERWISRRLGPKVYLVIALDMGIAVGMVNEFPDQKLETVWLDTHPTDHWQHRGEYTLKFADIDPVLASEVLADLTELTA